MAVHLSKQQELDADPEAIRQIDFTGNLDWAGNTTTFFITEETKITWLWIFHNERWEYWNFYLL